MLCFVPMLRGCILLCKEEDSCVACLTEFVNCLVKQFAICLGLIAILLLNVMEVFSVSGDALLDRLCMVFQRMYVYVFVSTHLRVYTIRMLHTPPQHVRY